MWRRPIDKVSPNRKRNDKLRDSDKLRVSRKRVVGRTTPPKIPRLVQDLVIIKSTPYFFE